MIISKLYGNYILTIILGLATLSMLAYGEKKRQMEMGCDHTWTVEESLKAAGKKSSMDDAFCELQRCNKCGDKRGVIITINGHDEVCVGWVKRQIANTTDNASKE